MNTNEQSTFKVVILEDDPMQAESLVEALREHAPDAEFQYFESENSISEKLESSVLGFNPHLFILDLMVRAVSLEEFTEGSRENIPRFGDPSEAGLRVANKIRAVETFSESPIIVWSVLDDPREKSVGNLRKTLFFRKGEDIERLILAVRSVAAATHRPLPKPTKSRISKAAGAAELKPSFMGVSIDLKKLWEVLTNG